jgi:hypothetical protein
MPVGFPFWRISYARSSAISELSYRKPKSRRMLSVFGLKFQLGAR